MGGAKNHSFKLASVKVILELSIIILAIVLPTIPFDFPGYVPRHSIYLLPYSIILFFILINKLLGNIIYSLSIRENQ